mgnify:CR=1 FL=1
MIIDIPSQADYEQTSTELFITAWRSVIGLLVERRETEQSTNGINITDYLPTIQAELRSALALVHQGVEFDLRGRICDVSPYLLIAGTPPQNWPKKCSQIDVSFSSFRSIDAQDLVKIVNTVCKERLTDQFVTWFEQLRVRRNQITHSVANTSLLEEIDVLRLLLDASEFLRGHGALMNIRKSSLLRTSEVVLSRYLEIEENVSAAYHLGTVQQEFVVVADSLLPSESKRYFDFDKKMKRHICANCLTLRNQEYFFELKNLEWYYCATAVMLSAEEIFCLVCREKGRIDETQ